MKELDDRLLAAHAAGDRNALARLYAEAADGSGLGPDPDRAAERFFLTQAYVYALESGSPDSTGLRRRLVELGSEEPDDAP